MVIHEPAVVYTDMGLAALGAFFAWRLRRGSIHGVAVMAGLASAAFWGAIFHALFPAQNPTTGGYVVWLLVAFSIAVVAESLLDLSLRVIFGRLTPVVSLKFTNVRRLIVLLYCLLFAVVVLLIDESFSTVVKLYAPTVLLALMAAILDRRSLIATGLLLSVLAAMLQQAHVALHPVYFNHNAVYHVMQAAALILLYLGFREQRRADQTVRA